MPSTQETRDDAGTASLAVEMDLLQQADNIIRLERSGDHDEALNLLRGQVLSAKVMAELAWHLYLNQAFTSAKLLINSLLPWRLPPLDFASAHIEALQTYPQHLPKGLDALHSPAIRLALETVFAHSFSRAVVEGEMNKAERLDALYNHISNLLPEPKDRDVFCLNNEEVLCFRWQGQKHLFATTDANSALAALDILNDETYGLQDIEPFLKPEKKTILDIGGNVGAFSLHATKTWPDSRVYSFEPATASFNCLAFNLRHFSNVSPSRFGLGEADETPVLHNSIAGSLGASVLASGSNMNGGEQVTIRRASTVMEELDIADIDIIKLDSEGYELPILTSLADRARNARVIFVEYHSEDDRRRLDDQLANSHHAFRGRILHPHRGEICFVRQDLASAWNIFRLEHPSSPELN